MVMLQADGLSKIYQMMSESNKIFAIISASMKTLTTEENEKRIEQLIKDVYDLGYSFTHMARGYLENRQLKSGYGHSLFVPNIKKEEALKLAEKYNQDTVLYKDREGLKYYKQNGELEQEIKTNNLIVGNNFDLDKIKPYFIKKVNYENINQKELYIFAYEPWTLMGKHRAYLNCVDADDFTSCAPTCVM